MSSDLTFITNEAGQSLADRFSVLLGANARFFDCLAGYFFISGFYRLHPALTKTEKVRGDRNAAYVLKRLKAREIRRCPQFTEDDEEFVHRIIRLTEEGSLPKRAAKLKTEIEPLKVLAILRRGVKSELFQTAPVAHATQALAHREVILSSYLLAANPVSTKP